MKKIYEIPAVEVTVFNNECDIMNMTSALVMTPTEIDEELE